MTQIPAGTQFDVIVNGQEGLLTGGATSIVENMIPYLQNAGLTFYGNTVTHSSILSSLVPGPFSADIVVESSADTDDQTVIANVAQAYNLVTKGNAIISVPYVGGQSTGQPGQASNAANSVGDAITQFFAKLQSLGTSLLIGLAAVVIVVLLIVAYGPNVKHIAAAA